MKDRDTLQKQIDRTEKKLTRLKREFEEAKPKKDMGSFATEIDEVISFFYSQFAINANNNDLHIISYGSEDEFVAVTGSLNDAYILRGRLRNTMNGFGIMETNLMINKHVLTIQANFKLAVCHNNPELV